MKIEFALFLSSERAVVFACWNQFTLQTGLCNTPSYSRFWYVIVAWSVLELITILYAADNVIVGISAIFVIYGKLSSQVVFCFEITRTCSMYEYVGMCFVR